MGFHGLFVGLGETEDRIKEGKAEVMRGNILCSVVFTSRIRVIYIPLNNSWHQNRKAWHTQAQQSSNQVLKNPHIFSTSHSPPTHQSIYTHTVSTLLNPNLDSFATSVG